MRDSTPTSRPRPHRVGDHAGARAPRAAVSTKSFASLVPGRVKRWRMHLSPRLLTADFAATLVVALTLTAAAQQPPPKTPPPLPLQPLAQQVRRLETALRYFGEPLPAEDQRAIDLAIGSTDEAVAVLRLQEILDRHVLTTVHISPESRVRVEPG